MTLGTLCLPTESRGEFPSPHHPCPLGKCDQAYFHVFTSRLPLPKAQRRGHAGSLCKQPRKAEQQRCSRLLCMATHVLHSSTGTTKPLKELMGPIRKQYCLFVFFLKKKKNPKVNIQNKSNKPGLQVWKEHSLRLQHSPSYLFSAPWCHNVPCLAFLNDWSIHVLFLEQL